MIIETIDHPIPHPHGLSPAAYLGCVSFLNSKPLIEPLLTRDDLSIRFAVPSALLPLMEQGPATGGVATALMSVVDFHASSADLLLVPAGMIGCDGPTLTVRIFSRVPAEKIHTLHVDTDSHTSVILAEIILRERHGASPRLLPLPSTDAVPQAMLLIGDKVVNASPSHADYPYQLDLGEEWKHLTGLPFVFAMWMMRKDALAAAPPAAQAVATLLDDARRSGADLTETLLNRYAHEKQWPRELARQYFTQYLRYHVTPRARDGLRAFFEMAGRLGLLQLRRPIEFLELPAPSPTAPPNLSTRSDP